MGKLDILGMFGDAISGIFKMSDDAYSKGWLWYLLFGILIIVVFILFFN